MTNVRITTGGLRATEATVQIDGHDVAGGIRSLRLAAGDGETTQLHLEVIANEVAEFDGDAVVGFDRDFTAVLVGLGWTPPTATGAGARTIQAAADAVTTSRQQLAQLLIEECPGPHRFDQHRDHRPPWCNACRYTALGQHIARTGGPV